MRPAAMGLLAWLVLVPAASGAQIVVTTATDVVAVDGVCSLREAVIAAAGNQNYGDCPGGDPGGTDEILLGASTYGLGVEGRSEQAGATGDLDTGAGAVRITGVGSALTTVDANGIDRVFDVPVGGSLTLEDLTLREGALSLTTPEPGGAVRSQGTLVVRRVVLHDNAAGRGGPGTLNGASGQVGGDGGAIWSAGSLSLSDTLVAANHAGAGGDGAQGQGVPPGAGGRGGFGGGIAIAGGTATVQRSTFTANRAGDGGRGGLDLLNIPNRAAGGGGGWAGALDVGPTATVSVENSTFASNRAGDAGAGGAGTGVPGAAGAVLEALSGGSLTVTWSTFAGNQRGAGGTGAQAIGGGVAVGASILADAAPACTDGFTAPLAVNVIGPSDASCSLALVEAVPSLGALAANGGPTPTMLPAAGSAAVDLLPPAGCPALDQRGLPRPQFGACDAGAVELQPAPAPGAPGAGGGGAVGGRAVLSGLRIVPATVRPTGRARRVGLAAFRLDRASTVTFRVRRLLAGRRLAVRCVAPRPALRGARRCLRRVAVAGKIVRAGTPGPNTLRVTGRFGGRLLPAGRYELVARVPGGPPVARGFRVLR